MPDLEWTPMPPHLGDDNSSDSSDKLVANTEAGTNATAGTGASAMRAPTPFGVPQKQQDYNLPSTFLYGEGHVWAQIDDLVATIGLTEFLFDLIYRQYFFLQLPAEGEIVTRARVIGAIDALKMAIPIVSPVSGTIMEINSDVLENPQLPLLSPYSRGWLMKLELSQPIELRQLMRQQDYKQLLKGPNRLDFAKSV